jgi:hypothetical protein
MQLIEVAPQGAGWMLTGPGEPLFFHSGRWAEQTARRLASAIAEAGHFAELRIWDRAGGLAGALRFKPPHLREAAPEPRRPVRPTSRPPVRYACA